MTCGAMKKSGADLRKAIMTAKGMTSSEGLRGIEYQLLNALAVRNVNKFMDVVMRLYSAYGSKRNEDGHELLIPTGFVQMLNDKQKFTEYGYAFVMGLVGSYEKRRFNIYSNFPGRKCELWRRNWKYFITEKNDQRRL